MPDDLKTKVLFIGLSTVLQSVFLLDRPTNSGNPRLEQTWQIAGGKAVHALRSFLRLSKENSSVQASFIGLSGGASGQAFARLVSQDGLPVTLVPIAAPTRRCATVLSPVDHHIVSEVREPLAVLSGEELRTIETLIYSQLNEDLPGKDCPQPKKGILVLCGPAPRGVDPEFYRRLLTYGRNQGWICIIDVPGAYLGAALQAQPHVVKTGAAEFGRLFPGGLDAPSAELTLLTHASRGIEAKLGTGLRVSRSLPAGMMGNSMGAGDAFLAGLIAYLCSYPIPNSQAELNCLVDWGNQAALAHIRGPVLGRPERVLTRGSGVV